MVASEVVFRRARAEDLPEIIALLADDDLGSQREDTGLPVSEVYLSAFQAIEADPNQLLAVADAGGEIAGTFQLTFIPMIVRRGSLRGQIEAVRVARGQRGSGLGQRMMEWAIAQCRERNCALVQLTSDKTRADALRFYERLGFKATHEGFKLALQASAVTPDGR